MATLKVKLKTHTNVKKCVCKANHDVLSHHNCKNVCLKQKCKVFHTAEQFEIEVKTKRFKIFH